MNTREGLPQTGGKYLCVYCRRPEETDDHTPPKRLLRRPLPSNLITLPSCHPCNNRYSKSEEIIRTFISIVSSHPDIQPGTKDGDAARRGLERNATLRTLMDAQRSGNGFKITPDLLQIFETVLQKTARGLFYGRYEQLQPLSEFRLLSIEDSRSTTLENVVDRIRPRVLDVTEEPLPEVSESMRDRYFVLSCNSLPLAGGGSPVQIQKVLRFIQDQPVEWISLQTGVFKFGFLQRQPEGGGAFVMELWSTLIVAVSAPWPGDRGPILKGRNNPYSREHGGSVRESRTSNEVERLRTAPPGQSELPLGSPPGPTDSRSHKS